MKWLPLVGGSIGLGVTAWLLESYGVGRILDSIGHAGWIGLSTLVAFHGLQVLFSALGWRVIAEPCPARAPLRTYVVLRFIREAVNNLLPLAQIGGEVIGWRLLRQRGTPLAAAIAGTVADLTIEMMTQILFALLGLILLLRTAEDSGIAAAALGGLIAASLIMAALVAAVRLGVAGFIERGVLRLVRALGWAGAAHVEGLNLALMKSYRAPGRVVLSGSWHMVSWLLGGVEVWLALHFLGMDMSITACLVIESLGQAAKALGFAVPGALGVQEGGYVLVGRTFGLSPEVAVALSLIKRLREIALGVPGLFVWQHWEHKARTADFESRSRVLP